MSRKNPIWGIAILAVVALSSVANTANASFRMRLERSDLGVGVVVTDNNVSGADGDTNPMAGFMQVSTTIAGVTIITGTGFQQPPIGGLVGAQVAGLDLLGGTIQSGGAATVVLSLQATGYFGGADGLVDALNSVGGSATGTTSLTFRAWANPLDAVENYGADQLTPAALAGKGVVPGGSVAANPLAFVNGAFSGTDAFGFVKAGMYSLFVEATIVFGAQGGLVTFDNHLTVSVPEPATIMAALTGLPFLGGYVLRRRKAAASLSI